MSEPVWPETHALDEAVVRTLMSSTLPQALPEWLEQRRWYADKGRAMRDVEIVDALIARVAEDWLTLAVIRLRFADGESARYLLPLALTRSAVRNATPPLALAGAHRVVDATETPWFGHWLIDRMARGSPSGRNWEFSSQVDAQDWFGRSRVSDAVNMGVEQSNTSIRFDEALIVKVIRRLQPGPNPDEEMLRALSDVGFDHVPAFAGSASWRGADGVAYPIALAQRFMPNQGDGWAWMLRRLQEVAAGDFDANGGAFAPERLLGQRTGELHVASGRVTTPAFTPESADASVAEENERRTRAALDDALSLLREREPMLQARLRERLPRALPAVATLAAAAAGFDAESGALRVRVHGDYHLGQTLRTIDGDWSIIDFEGEPARPVAERRRKLSALKDVAGMLRSFAYARGVTEKSLEPGSDAAVSERLATWEQGARGAFLEGYRAAVKSAHIPLVPADDADFARALAAWELDKALYEIAYEARNRPDWIDIPLRGLLPNPEDQRDELAGGAPA